MPSTVDHALRGRQILRFAAHIKAIAATAATSADGDDPARAATADRDVKSASLLTPKVLEQARLLGGGGNNADRQDKEQEQEQKRRDRAAAPAEFPFPPSWLSNHSALANTLRRLDDWCAAAPALAAPALAAPAAVVSEEGGGGAAADRAVAGNDDNALLPAVTIDDGGGPGTAAGRRKATSGAITTGTTAVMGSGDVVTLPPVARAAESTTAMRPPPPPPADQAQGKGAEVADGQDNNGGTYDGEGAGSSSLSTDRKNQGPRPLDWRLPLSTTPDSILKTLERSLGSLDLSIAAAADGGSSFQASGAEVAGGAAQSVAAPTGSSPPPRGQKLETQQGQGQGQPPQQQKTRDKGKERASPIPVVAASAAVDNEQAKELGRGRGRGKNMAGLLARLSREEGEALMARFQEDGAQWYQAYRQERMRGRGSHQLWGAEENGMRGLGVGVQTSVAGVRRMAEARRDRA